MCPADRRRSSEVFILAVVSDVAFFLGEVVSSATVHIMIVCLSIYFVDSTI